MNSTREHRGAEQRDDVELHGDAVALVPEPVHFAHHALLLGHSQVAEQRQNRAVHLHQDGVAVEGHVEEEGTG